MYYKFLTSPRLEVTHLLSISINVLMTKQSQHTCWLFALYYIERLLPHSGRPYSSQSKSSSYAYKCVKRLLNIIIITAVFANVNYK